MRTVNIHEAKTQLSRLVDAAAKGEPFIIARAGKPLVKVVPIDSPAAPKRLGFMRRAPSPFPTISTRWGRRKSRRCSASMNEAPARPHILVWGAVEPERLSRAARALIEDERQRSPFSAVSLWEIAIKAGSGAPDFQIDVGELRRNLFDNGYSEIAATGAHAVALGQPPAHSQGPVRSDVGGAGYGRGAHTHHPRSGRRQIPGAGPARLTGGRPASPLQARQIEALLLARSRSPPRSPRRRGA